MNFYSPNEHAAIAQDVRAAFALLQRIRPRLHDHHTGSRSREQRALTRTFSELLGLMNCMWMRSDCEDPSAYCASPVVDLDSELDE